MPTGSTHTRTSPPKALVPTPVPGPRREFHVARSARDTYRFDDDAFSLEGHVLFCRRARGP